MVDEAPASLLLSNTSFLSHSTGRGAKPVRSVANGADLTMINRNATEELYKDVPIQTRTSGEFRIDASNPFNYDDAQQCTTITI